MRKFLVALSFLAIGVSGLAHAQQIDRNLFEYQGGYLLKRGSTYWDYRSNGSYEYSVHYINEYMMELRGTNHNDSIIVTDTEARSSRGWLRGQWDNRRLIMLIMVNEPTAVIRLEKIGGSTWHFQQYSGTNEVANYYLKEEHRDYSVITLRYPNSELTYTLLNNGRLFRNVSGNSTMVSEGAEWVDRGVYN